MKKHQHAPILKRTQLSLAIIGILSAPALLANPIGAQIVSGQISIDSSIPGTMNITNSPGAIINWQNFSIAQGEITRFIQQNSQSTVLNRVIGGNPSQIMGQLISNGQVMLINPNGMVFGVNSLINTNGFIASTLAISDQDFLAGNYHFIAGSQAGSIFNEGIIRTGEDGNIVLIAPDIENNGIIQTDGGKIVLAAGQELTITSLDDPQIRFQVQAPDNEVLNLGQVLSNGGAIDLFAGTLVHSGDINSESLTLDASGNITFKTESDITLTSSSIVNANSNNDSGDIFIQSTQGTTLISGQITSTSTNSNGGNITLLGNKVGLIESATIGASGESGGEILIGGDYRGENPDIQNAKATFIGEDVTIKANADEDGNGGRVIVWADEATRMYGSIEAKGGTQSGDGGFVETSAHYLDIGDIAPDVSATHGSGGTWLLDPYNITVTAAGGTLDGSTPNFFSNANDSTVSAGVISTALNVGGDVFIDTTQNGGAQEGNITINSGIYKTAGVDSTLTLNAGNNIYFNDNIEAVFDGGVGVLNLNLIVGNDGLDVGTVNIEGDGLVIGLNGGMFQVIDNSDGLSELDATFNINGSAFNLEHMIWYHEGAVYWNSSNAINEVLGFTGTSFTNAGTFTDNTIGSLYSFISTGGTINNLGIWTKLGAADNTTIASPFINNGYVYVNQNSFVLTGNSTDASGSYIVSLIDNALLRFGASAKVLSGTTSIDGPVDIYQGNTYFTGGTYEFTDFTLSGSGYAHFQNSPTIYANTVSILGSGYLNQSGSNTFNIDDLTLSSGQINGSGNITVSNSFDWSGVATLGLSGLFTTDTLSTTTITSIYGASKTFSSGTWLNNGTIDWNASGSYPQVTMSSSTLNNTGTFNDNSTASIYASFGAGGTGTINNSGTWNKAGTGALSRIDATFNNTGNVNVTNGELRLNFDGIDTGNYTIAGTNNALLSFNTGNRSLTGSTITGPGSAEVAGGTVFFSLGSADSLIVSGGTATFDDAGTYLVDNLTLSGGTINGAGDITISNSFDWAGLSYLSSSGTFTTSASTTSTISTDTAYLQNGTWLNQGTINWNGDGGQYDTISMAYSTFNNAGTFNDNTTSSLYNQWSVLTSGTINNSGTWNKLGTATLSRVNPVFNNTYTVNVTNNELRLLAGGNDSGDYNIAGTNNALLTFSAGTRTLSNSEITGPGSLQITGGTVNFDLGQADTMIINGGTAVFNSGNYLINDLTFSSGGIGGTGDITISNSFDWSGGGQFLQGVFTTGSLATTSITANAVGLSYVTWENDGVINWYGDGGSLDNISFAFGATLNNIGTFNDYTSIINGSGFGVDNGGTVNNTGTWNKTNPYITYIPAPFNNSGVVNIAAGTLNITSDNTSSGSFNVSAGAVLNLTGSSVVLDHPNDFTGLGDVFFGATSTITFDAIQNGAYDQATTFIIDNGPLTLSSFDSANISNGSLTYDALNGTMTYTPNSGFSGTGDFFTFVIADTANEGFASGTITMNIASSSSSFTWSGPTSGTASWDNPAFWGGVVPTNGSDVTIPFVSGNLTIQYSTGSLSLNTLTSNESLLVSGGTLTLGDALADSSSFASGTSFSLSGGTFGGAGSIDILGNFNWTGGTLTGNGDLDLSNATAVNLSGTLTQSGMNITFPSGSLASGTTYNLLGGSFNTVNSTNAFGATMNINGGNFNASGNVIIDGSLNWASGGITTGGTVTIGSTGVVTIAGDNTSSQATVVNNGTVKKTAGTGIATISTGSFTNTGTVQSLSGRINFGNTYTQTAGVTTLNGGSIQATTTTLNGGSLTGSGTIIGNVINNANVSPGFSPGLISITGDYTQGASGILNMEIAGTTIGSYDRLLVTGTANLDGTLNIIPIAPYTTNAVVGDQFNLITAGTMFGDFSTHLTTTGYSFSTDYFAAVYTATTSLVSPTTITQPIVNTVVDIQTTDVLTLTEQAILDSNLELTPDSSTEDPDDSTNETETETGTTLASNEEVEGTLMICY